MEQGGRDVSVIHPDLSSRPVHNLTVDLLILREEVDKVFVVHDLLLFDWHYHLHLVLEDDKGLEQGIAITHEAIDDVVVVAFESVVVRDTFIDGEHLPEPLELHLSCEDRQLVEALLEVSP